MMLGEKHKVQVRIPKTYSVKRGKEINLWRASHNKITYMRDQFEKKQCCFTHEAKWFIVASIVASPKLSGAALEVLMHGITRSVLEVLNIEYTEDTILNILPCKKTVEGWIEAFACSVLYVCSVRLNEEDGVGAYLLTDKAKEKVKQERDDESNLKMVPITGHTQIAGWSSLYLCIGLQSNRKHYT